MLAKYLPAAMNWFYLCYLSPQHGEILKVVGSYLLNYYVNAYVFFCQQVPIRTYYRKPIDLYT